ncbi:unnamed protein product [Soboliphyme baturini]|uniref:Cystatin domain-containing protein n=1 Tax=Soboliphyme baturini TaxID=241478 RepID=A0A183IJP1_9BILA|nr:unnamed protein product [Soboliphyme baturini]
MIQKLEFAFLFQIPIGILKPARLRKEEGWRPWRSLHKSSPSATHRIDATENYTGPDVTRATKGRAGCSGIEAHGENSAVRPSSSLSANLGRGNTTTADEDRRNDDEDTTFKKWLGNTEPSTHARYIEARKAAAIAVAKAKSDSWEKFGEALESNFYTAKKVFWQTIRRLREEKNGSLKVLKDRTGHSFIKDDDILRRLREYFEELLNPTQPQEDSPVEQKGEQGMCWLTRVCQTAMTAGKTPADWRTGVIVPVFKKGDHKECSNYRGITLLSLPCKVCAKVLERRCCEVEKCSLKKHAAKCDVTGMRGNASKTKSLVFSRSSARCSLQINGEAVEQVEKFRRVAGLALNMVGKTDVLDVLGVERLFLQIEKTQLRWFGRVLRMRSEEKDKQLFLAIRPAEGPRDSTMLLIFTFACLLLVANGEMMPGAPVDQDTTDPKAIEVACDGVKALNRKLTGNVHQQLVGIKSFKTQVVSGIAYTVKFYVAEFMNQPSHPGEMKHPTVVKLCTVSRIDRPWDPIPPSTNVEVPCESVPAGQGPKHLQKIKC